MKQTKSQNAKILAHLSRGGTINPMQALKKYGCFRLASRIMDLRMDGHNIVSEMVRRNGVRFAQYKLGGGKA